LTPRATKDSSRVSSGLWKVLTLAAELLTEHACKN